MSQVSRQLIRKYAAAVVVVVVVTLLKQVIISPSVGTQQWFLLYVAAICLSSWYGGYGPGALTAILCTLASDYYFVAPIGTLDLTAASAVLQLMLFLLEGLLVVGLTGNLREARAQAERSERSKDEALALLDTFQIYAPVGLAFFDNDLRYIRINYAMAALDGLIPAAHIGRTLQEVQPQISSATMDGIQEVLRTGKPLLDLETTAVKPTLLGTKTQYFSTSYYRICGIDGQPLGIGAVMVDVSERHEAENVLRESEARFRTMADGAPVMIWMADAEKRCTYFNQGWLEFTGRAMADELGSGWRDDVHKDDLERCVDTYVTAFDHRDPFMVEYRLRRHDGEHRWVTERGVPLFTPDHQFQGYIASCVDTHERKLLEVGQQFVLEAGIILTSSLEYATTLANVAKLAVPTIADWCAVDILSDDGTELRRLAVEHIDPEKVKWAYQLQQRYQVDLNGQGGVAEAIRSGKTQFTPEVTPEMIDALAPDDAAATNRRAAWADLGDHRAAGRTRAHGWRADAGHGGIEAALHAE